MAMSRSRGGTSLTMSPPIQISPDVISSRPAIILSVVDLPHPEGPTSTTNSSSAISRSIPFTAWTLPSNDFTTLRIDTPAIRPPLALGGTGGQAGDVVIHQERINDNGGSRGEYAAR